MARFSIDMEVSLEIDYTIYPAEPDVGIMHRYVGEMCLIGNDGKELEGINKLLSKEQLANIEEEILQNEGDSHN